MSGGEYDNDHEALLGSDPLGVEDDVENQGGNRSNKGLTDLLNRLDRKFSGPRLNSSRSGRQHSPFSDRRAEGSGVGDAGDDVLGESAPPEWALLLIGCLLGLATGLCVAAFYRTVNIIHEFVWAGTPNEGAAWLRLQRLADTWHRILLIPVTGGVIVGMLHGLNEILQQIKQSTLGTGQGFDLLAGVCPVIKAIQAAVTLGTGCSLGPEGPSVDIGKSCASGCSVMMENNRERRLALVAAGAAAGIASGFNAAVAGCFFAIETVLKPCGAENSPPFTTAMIILASVVSSTVSNAILGEIKAFTVPKYQLKSAAELPLYLILGMLCGIVSVVFTRLVEWNTKAFEFIKEKFGVPAVACPALGGLGAGIVALRYPGILYWGFTNVNEILHTGRIASAPGIWLLAQLVIAKVFATTLCKASGLVGGLYAPSLMIGAAVGAVFGGLAGEIINSAIPGNGSVAPPQAYALVGMAATLASVCSVPLTSVLLLFELTKDYTILLPLMGAVGLAIWVPSVLNQPKQTELSYSRKMTRGYSQLSPTGDETNGIWRRVNEANESELTVIQTNDDLETVLDDDIILEDKKVSQVMTINYMKISGNTTLKEAVMIMHDSLQKCLLVVDNSDFLEGILTYGDIKRFFSRKYGDLPTSAIKLDDVEKHPISSICTRGIKYNGKRRGLLTCYPDTDLAMAKKLMEAKDIKQLPVINRRRDEHERRRKAIAILFYHSVVSCLSLRSEEVNNRNLGYQDRNEEH